MRSYTIDEIDKLREVIRHKHLFGSYRHDWRRTRSGPYDPCDVTKQVEERVRTHMLAGHTADDLLASEPEPPENPVVRDRRLFGEILSKNKIPKPHGLSSSSNCGSRSSTQQWHFDNGTWLQATLTGSGTVTVKHYLDVKALAPQNTAAWLIDLSKDDMPADLIELFR